MVAALPGRRWQRYVQTKVVVNGCRKTVYLHRQVWEKSHGPIPAGHAIHHKNHDRADNRLMNLELIKINAHNRIHASAGGLARARKMAGA